MVHLLRPRRPAGTLLAAALAALLATSAAAQDQAVETPEPSDEAGPSTERPEAEAADGAADPEAFNASTVIATVGDTPVTLGELIAVRQALPAQYQSLPPEVLKEGLLEQLVNQTVLAVEAREAGLESRRDVALQLTNLVNSTLADTYMREAMRAAITEEAIEAEYQSRFAEAEPEEEVNAAHILVESEERAAEIREEIVGGREFADAATEYGTDGTKARGGDLGWFVRADMVPEFAEAAFALETGAISDPVETPFGWHLITVMDRRERAAPPLEEVQDDIVRALAEQAQREVLDAAKASVEVTLEAADFPPALLLADQLIAPEE